MQRNKYSDRVALIRHLHAGDTPISELLSKEILSEKESRLLLRRIIEEKAYDAVPLLKAKNFNFNWIYESNPRPQTALSMAARRGDFKMVSLLLSVGADPNLTNPLEVAVEHHQYVCVAVLLESLPQLGNAFLKAITFKSRTDELIEEYYEQNKDSILQTVKLLLSKIEYKSHINREAACLKLINEMFDYTRPVANVFELSIVDNIRYQIIVILLTAIQRKGNIHFYFLLAERLAKRNQLLILHHVFLGIDRADQFDLLRRVILHHGESYFCERFLRLVLHNLNVHDWTKVTDIHFYAYNKHLLSHLQTDFISITDVKAGLLTIMNRPGNTSQVFKNIFDIMRICKISFKLGNVYQQNLMHQIALASRVGIIEKEEFEGYVRLMQNLALSGLNPEEQDAFELSPLNHFCNVESANQLQLQAAREQILSCYHEYLFRTAITYLTRIYFLQNNDLHLHIERLPFDVLMLIGRAAHKDIPDRSAKELEKILQRVYTATRKICETKSYKNHSKFRANNLLGDATVTVDKPNWGCPPSPFAC